MNVTSYLSEDSGTIKMRQCGSDYKYCNGECHKCSIGYHNISTTTTTTTDNITFPPTTITPNNK